MKRREFILASGQLAMLAGVSTAADSRSLPQQARDALAKATRYVRSISTEGGYLWRYSLDLKERAGETKATATQVWIQPPGTPSMGVAFLRAYSATKDPLFLDAARAAGDALATGQLESGGWDYLIDFDSAKATGWLRRSDIGKVPATDAAKRKNTSTFDDDNSQSAVRFLLALADVTKGSTDPRDGRVRTALDYALKKMLETQYPNGAWPQRYDGKPRNAADYPVLKASRAKSLESRVQAAIAALDEQGRWVTKGDLKKRDFDFSDRVETSVFIRNVELLADYLAAAQ